MVIQNIIFDGSFCFLNRTPRGTLVILNRERAGLD